MDVHDDDNECDTAAALVTIPNLALCAPRWARRMGSGALRHEKWRNEWDKIREGSRKPSVDSDLGLRAPRKEKVRLTDKGRECLEDFTGLRRRLYLTLRSIFENMKISQLLVFLTFIPFLKSFYTSIFSLFSLFWLKIVHRSVLLKRTVDNTETPRLLGLCLLIYILADLMILSQLVYNIYPWYITVIDITLFTHITQKINQSNLFQGSFKSYQLSQREDAKCPQNTLQKAHG